MLVCMRRGAKPAELPVVEAVKVELVLNLKTKALLGSVAEGRCDGHHTTFISRGIVPPLREHQPRGSLHGSSYPPARVHHGARRRGRLRCVRGKRSRQSWIT
jgi:hypothetical protein